jgi:hypothetical protein
MIRIERSASSPNSLDLAVFRFPADSGAAIACSNFAPESNYTQWASKDEFERMGKNPEAQALFRKLAALAKSVAPAIYQVSSVHTR